MTVRTTGPYWEMMCWRRYYRENRRVEFGVPIVISSMKRQAHTVVTEQASLRMYKTLEGDRCVGPGFASISITVIKDKRGKRRERTRNTLGRGGLHLLLGVEGWSGLGIRIYMTLDRNYSSLCLERKRTSKEFGNEFRSNFLIEF